MEKYVMPLLAEKRRDKVRRYLNLKGSMPSYAFKGIPEMFKAIGRKPLVADKCVMKE